MIRPASLGSHAPRLFCKYCAHQGPGYASLTDGNGRKVRTCVSPIAFHVTLTLRGLMKSPPNHSHDENSRQDPRAPLFTYATFMHVGHIPAHSLTQLRSGPLGSSHRSCRAIPGPLLARENLRVRVRKIYLGIFCFLRFCGPVQMMRKSSVLKTVPRVGRY